MDNIDLTDNENIDKSELNPNDNDNVNTNYNANTNTNGNAATDANANEEYDFMKLFESAISLESFSSTLPTCTIYNSRNSNSVEDTLKNVDYGPFVTIPSNYPNALNFHNVNNNPNNNPNNNSNMTPSKQQNSLAQNNELEITDISNLSSKANYIIPKDKELLDSLSNIELLNDLLNYILELAASCSCCTTTLNGPTFYTCTCLSADGPNNTTNGTAISETNLNNPHNDPADGPASNLAFVFGKDTKKKVKSAFILWSHLKRCYLLKLFPLVSKSLGLEVKNRQSFETCPVEINNCLISFIAKISLFNKSLNLNSISLTGNNNPPLLNALGANNTNFSKDQPDPNYLLCNLLSRSNEDLEFIYEIIRQGFLLQPNLSTVSSIILLWLTKKYNNERHPFFKYSVVNTIPIASLNPVTVTASLSSSPTVSSPLNRTSSVITPSIGAPVGALEKAKQDNIVAGMSQDDILLNQITQRFILYFRYSIISGRKKDPETLFAFLKDTMHFYRFLAFEKHVTLDKQSWDILINTLMDLQLLLATIVENSLDLALLMTETVLVTLIRSRSKSLEHWKKLETVLSAVIETEGVATSWATLAVQFTYIMAESTFGLGLVSLKEENTRQKRNRKGASNVNLLSTNIQATSLSTPETSRKQYKKAPDEISEVLRISMNSNSKSKGSSFSEKTSSTDDISSLFASGINLWNDPVPFSQMKEMKDLFSKESLWTWKNLLFCCGKSHLVKNPDIHYELTSCIVSVWNILDRIRAIQSFHEKEIPSLFDFAGIIFKAVNMPPEYAKSSTLAAGCLGKMICRKGEHTIDSNWQQLYFMYILKFCKNPLGSVTVSLMSNSSRLYSLCLSGVNMTIPAVMNWVKATVTSKGAPEQAVRLAISLVGSLLCFEKYHASSLHYQKRIANQDAVIIYDPPIISSPHQALIDLKFGLFEILQLALYYHYENGNEDYCEMMLWNLAILCLEESVTHREENSTTEFLQNEILFLLLENICAKILPLVSAAADGLCLLAENFERIQVPEEMLKHIIDRIVWGISENLSIDSHAKRKDLVSIASMSSILFQCLVEWLMAVPSNVVSNPNIALRISEVIEEAIHVSGVGIKSIKDQEVAEKISGNETNKQESNELLKIYEHLREAAENTLLHLIHHLDHFPPINGPAMMNSMISDPISDNDFDIEKCHYFSFNDNTILTIFDLAPHEQKVRILIRNTTGKYCWDLKSFFHNLDEELAGIHHCASKPVHVQGKKVSQPSFGSDFSSGSDSLDLSTKGLDELERILLKVNGQFPECFYNIPEANSHSSTTEFKKTIARQLQEQHDNSTQPKSLETALPPKVSNGDSSTCLDAGRLFLSQTGLMNFDYLREGKLVMLSKNANLLRDIRGLDKKYSREVAKFALIYVGFGQEDEMMILRNSAGSVQYDEFVASLGWPVELEKHTGYSGGLDTKMVNDGMAIYYCSSTVEMIFHDATRMPSDNSDPKQLKKKRHIGNDQVHIVWNEHCRDYRSDTIGGDFGNAQIIINPLVNGLFAIDIYRDDLVRPFGPLQSRSVVTKECLGTLVRSTAMNAYRNALSAGAPKGMETHPFSLRKQQINLITSRHKSAATDTFEKHVSSVIISSSGLDAIKEKDVAES